MKEKEPHLWIHSGSLLLKRPAFPIAMLAFPNAGSMNTLHGMIMIWQILAQLDVRTAVSTFTNMHPVFT